MGEFSWGKVIEKFDYDFDGVTLSVVKYHPTLYVDGFAKQGCYSDDVSYHSEEMHRSCGSLFELLIYWLAHKQLGLNNGALAVGICKSLDIKSST